MQARLHEIITSEGKATDKNGGSEFPWMFDGAGLPDKASQLLRPLVPCFDSILCF